MQLYAKHENSPESHHFTLLNSTFYSSSICTSNRFYSYICIRDFAPYEFLSSYFDKMYEIKVSYKLKKVRYFIKDRASLSGLRRTRFLKINHLVFGGFQKNPLFSFFEKKQDFVI